MTGTGPPSSANTAPLLRANAPETLRDPDVTNSVDPAPTLMGMATVTVPLTMQNVPGDIVRDKYDPDVMNPGSVNDDPLHV